VYHRSEVFDHCYSAVNGCNVIALHIAKLQILDLKMFRTFLKLWKVLALALIQGQGQDLPTRSQGQDLQRVFSRILKAKPQGQQD